MENEIKRKDVVDGDCFICPIKNVCDYLKLSEKAVSCQSLWKFVGIERLKAKRKIVDGLKKISKSKKDLDEKYYEILEYLVNLDTQIKELEGK